MQCNTKKPKLLHKNGYFIIKKSYTVKELEKYLQKNKSKILEESGLSIQETDKEIAEHTKISGA